MPVVSSTPGHCTGARVWTGRVRQLSLEHDGRRAGVHVPRRRRCHPAGLKEEHFGHPQSFPAAADSPASQVCEGVDVHFVFVWRNVCCYLSTHWAVCSCLCDPGWCREHRGWSWLWRLWSLRSNPWSTSSWSAACSFWSLPSWESRSVGFHADFIVTTLKQVKVSIQLLVYTFYTSTITYHTDLMK